MSKRERREWRKNRRQRTSLQYRIIKRNLDAVEDTRFIAGTAEAMYPHFREWKNGNILGAEFARRMKSIFRGHIFDRMIEDKLLQKKVGKINKMADMLDIFAEKAISKKPIEISEFEKVWKPLTYLLRSEKAPITSAEEMISMLLEAVLKEKTLKVIPFPSHSDSLFFERSLKNVQQTLFEVIEKNLGKETFTAIVKSEKDIMPAVFQRMEIMHLQRG